MKQYKAVIQGGHTVRLFDLTVNQYTNIAKPLTLNNIKKLAEKYNVVNIENGKIVL